MNDWTIRVRLMLVAGMLTTLAACGGDSTVVASDPEDQETSDPAPDQPDQQPDQPDQQPDQPDQQPDQPDQQPDQPDQQPDQPDQQPDQPDQQPDQPDQQPDQPDQQPDQPDQQPDQPDQQPDQPDQQPDQPGTEQPPAGPITGADIDLTQAFSQSITCYTGKKPYYRTDVEAVWQVAFNGAALTFNGIGNDYPFGGPFGADATRENYSSSALLRTSLGQSGGTIYFVKDTTNQILSAGHNEFRGSEALSDTLECGENVRDQWLPVPDDPFFSSSAAAVAWPVGNGPEVNCAVTGADGSVGSVQLGQLQGIDNGDLIVRTGSGEVLLTVPGASSPDRDSSVQSVSSQETLGGLYSYQSAPTGADAQDSMTYRVDTRWNSLFTQLYQLTDQGFDGAYTRCVPAPTQPF